MRCAIKRVNKARAIDQEVASLRRYSLISVSCGGRLAVSRLDRRCDALVKLDFAVIQILSEQAFLPGIEKAPLRATSVMLVAEFDIASFSFHKNVRAIMVFVGKHAVI